MELTVYEEKKSSLNNPTEEWTSNCITRTPELPIFNHLNQLNFIICRGNFVAPYIASRINPSRMKSTWGTAIWCTSRFHPSSQLSQYHLQNHTKNLLEKARTITAKIISPAVKLQMFPIGDETYQVRAWRRKMTSSDCQQLTIEFIFTDGRNASHQTCN